MEQPLSPINNSRIQRCVPRATVCLKQSPGLKRTLYDNDKENGGSPVAKKTKVTVNAFDRMRDGAMRACVKDAREEMSKELSKRDAKIEQLDSTVKMLMKGFGEQSARISDLEVQVKKQDLHTDELYENIDYLLGRLDKHESQIDKNKNNVDHILTEQTNINKALDKRTRFNNNKLDELSESVKSMQAGLNRTDRENSKLWQKFQEHNLSFLSSFQPTDDRIDVLEKASEGIRKKLNNHEERIKAFEPSSQEAMEKAIEICGDDISDDEGSPAVFYDDEVRRKARLIKAEVLVPDGRLTLRDLMKVQPKSKKPNQQEVYERMLLEQEVKRREAKRRAYVVGVERAAARFLTRRRNSV